MIEFSKAVLKGVSINRQLFGKELKKLLIWCGNDDKQKMIIHEWCIKNYGNIYSDMIDDICLKINKSA
jgi:hypothetical protein